MATKLFQSELEAWETIHGPSEEAKQIRRETRRAFRNFFPNGHDESIRAFVASVASMAERGAELKKEVSTAHLAKVHPRALRFIAKHGIDYRPFSWRKLKPETLKIQPISRGCHLNSHYMMRIHCEIRSPRSHWVYVEGVALGPIVFPMLHAWNAVGIRGTVARDWTFYSGTQWTRYLGIPLTSEEHEKCRRLAHPRKPMYHLLLDKPHFPKIESYLKDLIAERAERR
jgi:hypothetical protein